MPEELRCVHCGGQAPANALITFRGEPICLHCKEDFLLHLRQGTLPDPYAIPFALLKRGAAKFIDWNTPFILYTTQFYFLELLGLENSYLAILGVVLCLFFYLSTIAIFTGRFGGSPGKLVFRLAVVDRRGEAIDYAMSFLRTLTEFLSVLSLGAGYAVAFADERGRTLHDRICQTTVKVRE